MIILGSSYISTIPLLGGGPPKKYFSRRVERVTVFRYGMGVYGGPNP